MPDAYYRLESPTQTEEKSCEQETSGELWGRGAFGSPYPAVKAYGGPLPRGKKGVEFTTEVKPDPRSFPGVPLWSGKRKGVRIEGEFAKIQVVITKNTQCQK
jgi:hypothetical protein